MTALAPDARVVVVGTGQGGFQLAASLRQEGFAGSVTLVGEEPGLPYQRPPLSKAYMADGEASRLLFKPAAFFERSDLGLITEARAARIDREACELELQDGRRLPYDHLVLATGARNFRPPLPGLEAEGVLELRTLADAARLRAALGEALAAGRRAVVIGGGFIGLEFAAVARLQGLETTVVEAAPRLMARAVSEAMSAHFLDLHRAMGTEVLLDAAAQAVEVEEGRAAGVLLKDGRRIAGGLILVATGVRPNAELAEAAGLAIGNGVSVDSDLLTSDPRISALGDCACFPLPEGGAIRLESVQAAADHARHVARRLVKGESAAYAAVPWFWSDQGEAKLQIAGLSAGAEEVVEATAQEGRRILLLFREGRLAAVESVNAPAEHMAARKLIGAPRSLLEKESWDLKRAAKAAAS